MRLLRLWRTMPTFVVTTAASLMLVVVVGLQAPALSVGLRWVPGPRSRTLDLVPVDVGEIILPLSNRQPENGWLRWVAWSLAAVAAVALAAALWRWVRAVTRRGPAIHVARTGADTGVLSEAAARILQSGLTSAIDVLTVERDPGNAVVQAWQGLQDAAAAAGLHRRPAETASEFTARILYRSRGSAASIAVLLSLYQRVRFGEHTPSADDIVEARNALTVLVELWRADFPERRPPKLVRQ